MKSTEKSLAVLTAAVLVFVLAVQMPSPASAQGSCTVSGSGTASGPTAEKFTRTNSTNGVILTYMVEEKCFDKGAAVGDNATAAFDVNATCNDASSPGSCASLNNLGTIGALMPSSEPCSSGTCTVGPETANTNATIPKNGTQVEILSGTASLKALRGDDTTVVARLGQVPITLPKGFVESDDDRESEMRSGVKIVPHFDIIFHTPPRVEVSKAACMIINGTLAKAGIPPATIHQVIAQLDCP